jgi:hypothetical protein
LYGVGLYLVLASVPLSALSLVDRLRWASGDERQQLKWFALATDMMLGGAAETLARLPLFREYSPYNKML